MPTLDPAPRRPRSINWRSLETNARRRFGIREFRPGQRELIECALTGRNALGILPTGAGKSLCYQLPSLYLHGAVVVVSPLIALMQDQYEHLAEAEIPAARLDSTVSEGEQRELEDAVTRGRSRHRARHAGAADQGRTHRAASTARRCSVRGR